MRGVIIIFLALILFIVIGSYFGIKREAEIKKLMPQAGEIHRFDTGPLTVEVNLSRDAYCRHYGNPAKIYCTGGIEILYPVQWEVLQIEEKISQITGEIYCYLITARNKEKMVQVWEVKLQHYGPHGTIWYIRPETRSSITFKPKDRVLTGIIQSPLFYI